jgi:putative addiction module killer protein
MIIKETKDFKDWFNALNKKEQAQVAARLERIKSFGHFGDAKNLGKGLCELRWKNGWRVYFIAGENSIILVIGGHKNEQEKNIKKARLYVSRNTTP